MEQTTRARNKKIVKILVASLVFIFIVFLLVVLSSLPPQKLSDGPRSDMLNMANIINGIDVDFRGIGRPDCSPFSREEFQMGSFREIFQGYRAGERCWHDDMGYQIESDSNYIKDYHTKEKTDYIVALKRERILLISVGPDGVLSAGEDEMRKLFENPPEGGSTESLSRDERMEEFLSRLEPYVYQATNGTGSNGDIFRLVTPRE